MIVTRELLETARTKKGGYSSSQVKYAQDGFGKQWLKGVLGKEVSQTWWTNFLTFRSKTKYPKDKKKRELINAYAREGKCWWWKPEDGDIPPPKYTTPTTTARKKKKKKVSKKSKRDTLSRKDNSSFYKSPEWQALRVRVKENYACKCMMCGMSPKDHGVVLHVDHIKPRSKYPHLSLVYENLQLLCEDCNMGKSNKYETDWRPTEQSLTEEDLLMANIHCLDRKHLYSLSRSDRIDVYLDLEGQDLQQLEGM